MTSPLLVVTIHTEDTALGEACSLYWDVDPDSLKFSFTVAEIAELTGDDKHQLPAKIKEACSVTIPTWQCPRCGAPYKVDSRQAFNVIRRHLLDDPQGQKFVGICRNCQEQEQIEKAARFREEQRAAQQERERQINERRQLIGQVFHLEDRPVIEIGTLSLTGLVYLYALLVAAAHEDLTIIRPIASLEQPLAPTNDYTTEILGYLLHHTPPLISVHPDSSPDAFLPDWSFYTWYVSYASPASKTDPDDPMLVMREILARINGEWPEEWYTEALDLWRRIARDECLKYLLHMLEEHHFEFSPGKKTQQYLDNALEHFSSGQVVNMIWRACKDAAALYQRGGISKKQAANTAVSSIQRQTERALAEQWNLTTYRRSYAFPQSTLSALFYNTVLRLGDEGFAAVPSLETIRARINRKG